MCRGINKKKGQATLESVLLMVMLLSLATIILKTMNDGEWMKKIMETPGNYIRGMSIAGVWKPCEDLSNFPERVGNCFAIRHHPNHISASILQVKGDKADD